MCIWRWHRVVRFFLLLILPAALAICHASTQALAQSGSNASVYRIFTQVRFPAAQQQQGQGNNEARQFVGTGFLVSGRRLVVTNNHVTSVFIESGGRRVLPTETAYFIGIVRNGNAVGVRARLVASLPEKDLAILEAAEDLPGTPFTIADYDPTLQSEVDAIGFPAVADIPIQASRRGMDNLTVAELLPTRTSGRMQRLFEAAALNIGGSPAPLTARILQHTASFSGGNSGGPLINRCDQVIGINTFTTTNNGALSLQSVSSVEAVRFLRAQNVQFRSASRFCLLPGSASDYITFPAVTGVLATVLGLIALVLAARKPQIIRETVSRVHNSFSRANRRPPSDGPRDGGWDQLRGSGSNDRPRDSGRDTPPPVRNAPPQRGPQQGDAVVRLVPASGGPAVEILARRMSNGRVAVLGRSREYLQEQNPSDHSVILDDKSISRRHARLTLDDRGRLTIEDLGSSSGTFKGDKKIESASFGTGDVVRFGAVSYRIVLPS